MQDSYKTIFLLIVVGFIGFYIYNENEKKKKPQTVTIQTPQPQPTTSGSTTSGSTTSGSTTSGSTTSGSTTSGSATSGSATSGSATSGATVNKSAQLSKTNQVNKPTVLYLQKLLNAKGFLGQNLQPLAEDGIYGNNTLYAHDNAIQMYSASGRSIAQLETAFSNALGSNWASSLPYPLNQFFS